MPPPLYSYAQTESLLRAYSIMAYVLIYPLKKCLKERPSLTKNGPKNLDFYLKAEKMIFMSPVQNVVVMWRLAVKRKV